MKTLLLTALAAMSFNAFAGAPNPNLIETGTWKVNCLVYTTGPSGNDVNTLAHGPFTIVMDNTNPKTVLYKEGPYEFRTWVRHFVPADHPEFASNMWQMGIFKNDKYMSGSSAEFISELPHGLQVVVKNMTKIKGPPKVAINCRQD